MPKQPLMSRRSTPSRSVHWLARNRTRAWPTVRRTVSMLLLPGRPWTAQTVSSRPCPMNTGPAHGLSLERVFQRPWRTPNYRSVRSGRLEEETIHPMFVKIFLETDEDELAYEEETRRRANRARYGRRIARPLVRVRPY